MTDESWKTHPSPNMLTGNWGFGVGGYGGEIWDANREVDGWNLSGFDDRIWDFAQSFYTCPYCCRTTRGTNRILDEIQPIAIESRPMAPSGWIWVLISPG